MAGSVVPMAQPPEVRQQMPSAPPDPTGADKAGGMPGGMSPQSDPKQALQAYTQKIQELEKWAGDFMTIASMVDPQVTPELLKHIAQIGKALQGRAQMMQQKQQEPAAGNPAGQPPPPNPAEGPTPSTEAVSGMAA